MTEEEAGRRLTREMRRLARKAIREDWRQSQVFEAVKAAAIKYSVSYHVAELIFTRFKWAVLDPEVAAHYAAYYKAVRKTR